MELEEPQDSHYNEMSPVMRVEKRAWRVSPVSTESVAGRGTVLQKPSLVLVCFRIWNGIWTAGTNVSRKRHRRQCITRTSIQRDFPACSGGRVAHNPYCGAKLVLAKAPLAEESAGPSVKLPMVKLGTNYVP